MEGWKAAQLGHLKAESLVEQSGAVMAVRLEFCWVAKTVRKRVGYLVDCLDAHLVVSTALWKAANSEHLMAAQKVVTWESQMAEK
jgi:hypothetical protein